MQTTAHTWLYRPGTGSPEVERVPAARRTGTWFRSLQTLFSRNDSVSVELAASTWLDRYTGGAAAPRVAVADLGHAWRFEVIAPGANTHNTSVTYDAETQTLTVAVWHGTPPHPERRYYFPRPAAVWMRRFQQPTADLGRAQARVHRGVITVEAPKREPQRASWEPQTEARAAPAV